MDDSNILNKPPILADIEAKSKAIGFTMPSDYKLGTLLKTLVTSKPGSRLLELGTGTGLSLAWIIDGMDSASHITTLDNDPQLSEMAKHYFGQDERVDIVCADGSEWLKSYKGKKFDLVFADAWPGKYSGIEEMLALIKVGGFYLVDDMQTQANWPEGHEKYVNSLVDYLEGRKDYNLTKMSWSTGLILMCRKF